MYNKSLTVIIPTKDEDATLLELIACLEKQTFRRFKIIVADSSTTDRVKEICLEKQICYIKGGLPGKARNNGVLHTDTDYVFFMDADISIENNFINRALNIAESRNFDCISFGFFPDTSNYFLKASHLIARLYFKVMSELGFARGIGGAILVKKMVHNLIGGFDESITVAEDHNYLKRISQSYRYYFSFSPSVKLNTRRFRKFGILTMSIKYFLIEAHRLFVGEIKNDKIAYFEKTDTIQKISDTIHFEKITAVNER